MAQWASLFAEKGLGISKTLGDLLGPCLFAVMMGIARTLYGVKGQKINMHKTLVFSSVMCILSFAITALVPVPAIALIGCSLCGLSVSLMWPGMLSLTAAGYPSAVPPCLLSWPSAAIWAAPSGRSSPALSLTKAV